MTTTDADLLLHGEACSPPPPDDPPAAPIPEPGAIVQVVAGVNI